MNDENQKTPHALDEDVELTEESTRLVEDLVRGPGQRIPKLAAALSVWSQSATSTYRPPVRRGDYEPKRRR